MASPAVVTTNANSLTTPGTSYNMALPASIVADNLLLAWVCVNVKDASTIVFPAGWNIIIDDIALASPATSREVFAWKKATGSEGATANLTQGTSTRWCAITYQVSGALDPSIQVPQFATIVTGSSTSMNAGAVTPTGGTKEYLFIVLGATPSASSVTVPTNYGGRLTITNALDLQLHACSRQATVSSEDPGGWAISPTNPWMSTVVAIHPTGVSGSLSQTLGAVTLVAAGTVGSPPAPGGARSPAMDGAWRGLLRGAR